MAKLAEGPAPSVVSCLRRITTHKPLLCWLCCAVFCSVYGCTRMHEQEIYPARYSVQSGQTIFRSNLKLSEKHDLVQEMVGLREQVREELALPVPKREVTVYLFASEEKYQQFLSVEYPHLPNRRAYFVGSSKGLSVYTYWGDRIREDLRHEYTHGLLHASLKSVPLWLDEGLAEYFEVPGESTGGINHEYVQNLALALAQGWQLDLASLEAVDEFSKLDYGDYQQSWAWVHYMLHGNATTRQILLTYLKDLRTDEKPYPLSKRLEEAIPDVQKQAANYLQEQFYSIAASGSLAVMQKESPQELFRSSVPASELFHSQPKRSSSSALAN